MKLTPAKDLKPGDRINLEGDPYADRYSDPIVEYELQVVEDLEQETPGCVRVDFENYYSVGFPPEHLLRVEDPS